MKVIVNDVVAALEQLAPVSYQESYDNVGLLVGNKNQEVSGILISLDCTEEVVQAAINQKNNVIVCHHPIIFKGLKRITGANYVERVVVMAIKNDISIIACHTNLDNMQAGVNAKIAEKLELQNCKILVPGKNTIRKFCTYVPKHYAEKVREGLFEVGAGQIGLYSNCSFNTEGVGTFQPLIGSNPMVGNAGGSEENIDEVKVEVIYHKHLESNIIKKLNSFTYYEEKAYEIYEITNINQSIGAGMIGTFNIPMPPSEFLKKVKKVFQTGCIRYTSLERDIQKVALCGGSGSFLLADAISQKADAFISADFKYHEFFDADDQIMITDIGHYESEQYTSEIFYDYLREKFTNFAIQINSGNTNPINYF